MKTNDVETGCLLPLAQSVVTGVLVGGLFAAIAQYAGWQQPALVGLALGALAGAGWWLSSITAWRRSTYPQPANEQMQPLRPEPPPSIRVEVARENGLDLIDLPVREDQIITLAQGVLSGGSLSEASWTGTGAPFTRAEFAALRNELIRRGLATWNNPHTPARGFALTAPGRAVMRRFAAMSPTPTPRGVVKTRR